MEGIPQVDYFRHAEISCRLSVWELPRTLFHHGLSRQALPHPFLEIEVNLWVERNPVAQFC